MGKIPITFAIENKMAGKCFHEQKAVKSNKLPAS